MGNQESFDGNQVVGQQNLRELCLELRRIQSSIFTCLPILTKTWTNLLKRQKNMASLNRSRSWLNWAFLEEDRLQKWWTCHGSGKTRQKSWTFSGTSRSRRLWSTSETPEPEKSIREFLVDLNLLAKSVQKWGFLGMVPWSIRRRFRFFWFGPGASWSTFRKTRSGPGNPQWLLPDPWFFEL